MMGVIDVFRSQTIKNAADRHRFVTDAAARPYLDKRGRANCQNLIRQLNKTITHVVTGWSEYGTKNQQQRAEILQELTGQLVRAVSVLPHYPTPAERREATQMAAAAD
jgi:hypothetical protein